MDAMLRALADGTRRQILALVWRQERTAGDIAAAFSVTRPAISQHLRVLLESELVQMRRAGTRRLYRADQRAMAALRSELATFWDNSLVKLKQAAEETEPTKGTRR
jgi:DNA-binding transcriptional ArsR family regulator